MWEEVVKKISDTKTQINNIKQQAEDCREEIHIQADTLIQTYAEYNEFDEKEIQKELQMSLDELDEIRDVIESGNLEELLKNEREIR